MKVSMNYGILEREAFSEKKKKRNLVKYERKLT